MNCKYCKGTGLVPQFLVSKQIQCKSCKGTGKKVLEVHYLKVDGSVGKVTRELHCKRCNGTGKKIAYQKSRLPVGYQKCKRCNGTGEFLGETFNPVFKKKLMGNKMEL